MNKILLYSCAVLALALLVCLLPMPYGYYTLVRFATMIIMACLAFLAYQNKQSHWCVVGVALALLFQPFAKIALGRDTWNIVDVVVAVGLICIVWKNYKQQK